MARDGRSTMTAACCNYYCKQKGVQVEIVAVFERIVKLEIVWLLGFG